MRSLVPYSSLILLWVSFYPALSPGQETGITRRHHPWGCFEEGEWKRVRVVTEELDEAPPVISTTETKTTLQEVTEDGVTLLVEVVVEVGGKRIQAEPQTIQQGWHGELANQDVKVTHLGAGEVVIRGLRIPCKIQQLELTGPGGKTTTKISYADTVEPFILKRESVTTDLEGTTKLGETTVDVMDVDVPCRLLANIIRNTFYIRAVHTHPKGRTTTLAFSSTRVPGGVIRSDSKEFDANGRLIRHSSLELLDYGLAADDEWIGPFGRRRHGPLHNVPHRPPYRLRLPPRAPH